MTRALLFILGLLLLASAPAPAADESVAEYRLGEGLTATVGMDGAITVHVSDGMFSAPALTCTWPVEPDPRLKQPPRTFAACAREGDIHGRRGFTHDDDDDGDRRSDEDRLDGEDNDDDGRIDEDFAAISHAMAVWNWSHGARSRHLETYHWSYPRLAGLIAAVFTADPGSSPEALRLSVPDADWIQADEFCFRAGENEAGPSFLARVPDPRGDERWIWLGVAMLDVETRRLINERVRVSGPELMVPLMGSTQAIALAAGPSRLRVVHDLFGAVAIRDGVTDPVSGERVPWLPAALPPTAPAADLPAAELLPDPVGGFDLVLTYSAAPRLFFDPDLFRLDGEALAVPEAMSWTDQTGHSETLAWPQDGGLFDACHPFDHLGMDGAGALALRYPDAPPAMGWTLEGVLEDGRLAALPVTIIPPAAVDPAVTDALDEPENQSLQLSPLLLTNYPNPFRSSTQVSFRIPATAGEAFLWDGEGEPPFDPRQRLPHAAGAASVTVTVYDLEGREIATLEDAILGVGQYRASWDGTDRTGRIMASGAYFCKLQIENWSVTKRLVFIR